MQPSFNNGWKTKPADRSFPWALPMAKVTMTFGQITLAHPVSRCLWDGLRLAFSQMLYGDMFPMGVAHGQGGNDLRPNYSRAPGFQMLLGLIEIGFQPNVVLDTFSMGVAHGYGDNDLRSNCSRAPGL